MKLKPPQAKNAIFGAFFITHVFALAGAASATGLPQLNLSSDGITVSGISSGAFMAVQFGVAHSKAVSGIAATAGGPYFCAGQDSWAGANVGTVMARCMQGDPSYPKQAITSDALAQWEAAARAWGTQGKIDDTNNLAKTRVWLFHGYNDGIVKKPANDALESWLLAFVPATQVFYKDNLRAAHAQISSRCDQTAAHACNPCAQTGGNFINTCPNTPATTAYDAAGAALQMFYGPLLAPTDATAGQLLEFSQKTYTTRSGQAVEPYKISMADTGYLYVPASCSAGQACRLHVAFHGCGQYAKLIGTDFVKGAGFNEWAASNGIVVLYPQALNSLTPPITPFNPQGCWDWWGYNDFGFDPAGHYATQDGAQIASIWRMVEKLAGGSAEQHSPSAGPLDAPSSLIVADASHRQVALSWSEVAGALGYHIYRGDTRLTSSPVGVALYVDRSVTPSTPYAYRVTAVAGDSSESAPSASVGVTTAVAPPQNCDPYFSITQNRVVDKNNRPTQRTCP